MVQTFSFMHGDDGDSKLGQTEKKSVQISGDDGSVFRAEVYTGVNVTRDPQLKNKLQDGTLNKVSSSGDGQRVFQPAVPVVYHDEKRKVLALVIPEPLRHQEFACRSALLQRLAASDEVLPDYMRDFDVVFDVARLDELDGAKSAPAAATDGALSEERKQLEIDREQLEEVATRVERDSARIDEAWTKIEKERAELEELRKEIEEGQRKIQVQELNLEQERLRLKNEGRLSGSKPHANDATQVVTDDQFIEVMDADETSGASAEAVAAAQPRRADPMSHEIRACESDEIFDHFSESDSDGGPTFVQTTSELVVAGFQVDQSRAKSFVSGDVQFFFQLHDVGGVPVIALTLAAFDADGDCVDAVAVPIVDGDDAERAVLEKLARDLHLHLALYAEDGARIAAWEAAAPIRRNIGWARQRIRQWRDSASDPAASKKAAKAVENGDVELVGSMNHPFDAQSFAEFQGASDVKLAVGIVGYWSQPEQLDYLIGNRSFSLEIFSEIQQRVVRQALHWGIAPGPDLRELALEEAIAVDSASLAQRLLSNFAEVCVGLRANDLDPIEQWENWDALIELAGSLGITPEPDVLELAEVSLNRAEEYETMLEEEGQDSPSSSPAGADGPSSAAGIDLDKQVVERPCNETGVTYYLPAGAGTGDHFDDLLAADRDTLTDALNDSARRLEASQILLEKFGASAVAEVLEAAEELNGSQVAALARFTQARADGLEGALMQSLDSAGPSATLVAARGLASIGSTASMPRLLDAARDPARRGPALAHCLALFEDKLVPLLSRALKKNPDDDDLVAVLAALEQTRKGTLDELANERDDELKEAASKARQMV